MNRPAGPNLEILRPIADDALGRLSEARQTELDRIVLHRSIDLERFADGGAALRSAVDAISRLRGPCVAQILFIDAEASRLQYSMKPHEGRPLGEAEVSDPPGVSLRRSTSERLESLKALLRAIKECAEAGLDISLIRESQIFVAAPIAFILVEPTLSSLAVAAPKGGERDTLGRCLMQVVEFATDPAWRSGSSSSEGAEAEAIRRTLIEAAGTRRPSDSRAVVEALLSAIDPILKRLAVSDSAVSGNRTWTSDLFSSRRLGTAAGVVVIVSLFAAATVFFVLGLVERRRRDQLAATPATEAVTAINRQRLEDLLGQGNRSELGQDAQNRRSPVAVTEHRAFQALSSDIRRSVSIASGGEPPAALDNDPEIDRMLVDDRDALRRMIAPLSTIVRDADPLSRAKNFELIARGAASGDISPRLFFALSTVLLESKDPLVRRHTAGALAFGLGGHFEHALDSLRSNLDLDKQGVEAVVPLVAFLGQFPSDLVEGALEELLLFPSPDKTAAIYSVGGFESELNLLRRKADDSVLGTWFGRLTCVPFHDRIGVREAALFALERSGSARAVTHARRVLDGAAAPLAMTAIEVLARRPEEVSIEELVAFYRADRRSVADDVLLAALRGVGARDPRRALDLVLRDLDNPARGANLLREIGLLAIQRDYIDSAADLREFAQRAPVDLVAAIARSDIRRLPSAWIAELLDDQADTETLLKSSIIAAHARSLDPRIPAILGAAALGADRPERVRVVALQALGASRNPAALDVIEGAAEANQPLPVRTAAFRVAVGAFSERSSRFQTYRLKFTQSITDVDARLSDLIGRIVLKDADRELAFEAMQVLGSRSDKLSLQVAATVAASERHIGLRLAAVEILNRVFSLDYDRTLAGSSSLTDAAKTLQSVVEGRRASDEALVAPIIQALSHLRVRQALPAVLGRLETSTDERVIIAALAFLSEFSTEDGVRATVIQQVADALSPRVALAVLGLAHRATIPIPEPALRGLLETGGFETSTELTFAVANALVDLGRPVDSRSLIQALHRLWDATLVNSTRFSSQVDIDVPYQIELPASRVSPSICARVQSANFDDALLGEFVEKLSDEDAVRLFELLILRVRRAGAPPENVDKALARLGIGVPRLIEILSSRPRSTSSSYFESDSWSDDASVRSAQPTAQVVADFLVEHYPSVPETRLHRARSTVTMESARNPLSETFRSGAAGSDIKRNFAPNDELIRRAIADLDAATSLRPDLVRETQREKARVYQAFGRDADAEKLLVEQFAAHPDDIESALGLAELQWRHDRAKETDATLARISSGSIRGEAEQRYWRLRLQVDLTQGRYAMTLEALRRMLESPLPRTDAGQLFGILEPVFKQLRNPTRRADADEIRRELRRFLANTLRYDFDAKNRERTARHLGDIGTVADLPFLRSAIRGDMEARVRAHALFAAFRIDAAFAAEEARRYLASKPTGRAAAVATLVAGRLDRDFALEAAVERLGMLRQRLEHVDARTFAAHKIYVLDVVAGLDLHELTGDVVEFLEFDPSPVIRWLAAGVLDLLAYRGHLVPVEALRRAALHDQREGVRRTAGNVLARIGDTDLFDAVIGDVEARLARGAAASTSVFDTEADALADAIDAFLRFDQRPHVHLLLGKLLTAERSRRLAEEEKRLEVLRNNATNFNDAGNWGMLAQELARLSNPDATAAFAKAAALEGEEDTYWRRQLDYLRESKVPPAADIPSQRASALEVSIERTLEGVGRAPAGPLPFGDVGLPEAVVRELARALTDLEQGAAAPLELPDYAVQTATALLKGDQKSLPTTAARLVERVDELMLDLASRPHLLSDAVEGHEYEFTSGNASRDDDPFHAELFQQGWFTEGVQMTVSSSVVIAFEGASRDLGSKSMPWIIVQPEVDRILGWWGRVRSP